MRVLLASRIIRASSIVAILFLQFLIQGCAKKDVPEADLLILHNASVWTVDEDNPRAQAVAIEEGKFIA